MPSRPRHVALLGDAADIRAWSGIPYHFHKAGRDAGFLDEALDARLGRLRLHRLAWNAAQALTGGGRGGFMWSRACQDRAWAAIEHESRGAELVSQTQLFPPPARAAAAGTEYGFYIDMPLARLFDDYGTHERVGRRVMAEALQREAESYDRARVVVAMARWGAEALRKDAGVPARKVKVVLPGANMDEAVVERLTAGLDNADVPAEFSSRRPFRLGFTGKDSERKGLPRLVEAARLLRREGLPVEVAVVGPLPEAFHHDPAVRWMGFIDKALDMERFVASLLTFDLGCLPSRAEALGISTLECLRLGVPVLGSDVGGIPDCIPARAGILVSPGATAEQLAHAIRPLVERPQVYEALRRGARAARHQASWERAIEDFRDAWSHA